MPIQIPQKKKKQLLVNPVSIWLECCFCVYATGVGSECYDWVVCDTQNEQCFVQLEILSIQHVNRNAVKGGIKDIYGDPDILFWVSHCFNCEMQNCIHDVFVLLGYCDVIISSFDERIFILRFARENGRPCRMRLNNV